MQAAPIIYMIRHGEKPDNGANDLSAQGVVRAQHLRQVFGENSGFNIGYIIAEHPKKGLGYSVYPLILPTTQPPPVANLNRIFYGLGQANERI
jgi:hypothetical protein